MGDILLSFLIPSIPSRLTSMLDPLLKRLLAQAEPYPEVEILSFVDNKRRSIGEKRGALVEMAQGKFLTISDDDDDVADDYFASVVPALRANPETDIVVFDQEASIDGETFLVKFGREFDNEPVSRGPDGRYVTIHRKPFHCCVWRSEHAKRETFPSIQYGEDWAWCEKVLAHVKTQVRIPKVLHKYRFNSFLTEAL